MKKLKETHAIKAYTTHTSAYPKASIIERQLREIKRIFFSHLFSFKVTNYEILCKLIQVAFNNRKHGGIFDFKPIQVFHDSHISCQVTRLSSTRYRQHQIESKSLFAKLKNSEKLEIGDKVLLTLPKKVIRKESSVFYPRFSEAAYLIEEVDKERFPYLYKLKDFPKANRK